ncbi:MAG: NAD(P)/FAD-dependent oxidoreductase [Clostridia bacterium]|nr:NAD(P)/FAD-dependent oxidoreductase [Clostridia bacterium]
MKKIIVAGAGHGGLCAAIHLAKAGYDVTVCERQKREQMGYDWFDAVGRSLFESAGLPEPPEGSMLPFYEMRYYSPDLLTSITKAGTGGGIRFMDRKVLIRYLLSLAEAAGVKLLFEKNITGVVASGSSILGIRLEDGGQLLGDLVIDAAGVDSPVRSALPEACGIQKTVPYEDRIVIYRAYFNRACPGVTDPRYNIYFYHCGKPGMDWMITEDDFIDILIGGFEKLSQEDIDTALADFRGRFPYIGDTVVRGGTVASIPLRKTLGIIVADGYAAIGDSACMTEPLSGSGITLSMRAGKLLADTLLAAGGDTSAKTLWRYQYKYFRAYGNGNLTMDIARKILKDLSTDDVDAFLTKEILTMKEIAGGEKYTAGDLYKKATGIFSMPQIFRPLLRSGGRLANMNAVCDAMPPQYDPAAVRAWASRYEKEL